MGVESEIAYSSGTFRTFVKSSVTLPNLFEISAFWRLSNSVSDSVLTLVVTLSIAGISAVGEIVLIVGVWGVK